MNESLQAIQPARGGKTTRKQPEPEDEMDEFATSFKANVSYEAFADRLIMQSGLKWPAQHQTFAQSTMRSVIVRLVINPMVSFGVLECEYAKEKSTFGNDIEKLKNIRLTAIGKGCWI